MKRILTALLIVLFLSTGVFAGEWCKQSAQKTGDAAITTKQGVFHGIMVVPPTNANSVTINIYDNATAASGAKLIPTTIIYAVESTVYDLPYSMIKPPVPVRFYKGIYVDITTDGTAKYMIYWKN